MMRITSFNFSKFKALNVIVFFTAMLITISGCSFNVKTPSVANYQKLNQLSTSNTSKDDIILSLGRPQSTGVHIKDGKRYDLFMYFGMAGEFSTSTGDMDYGNALLSFDTNNNLHEALYFRREKGEGKIKFGKDIPFKKLIKRVEPGKSTIDNVYNLIGPKYYYGRRINKVQDINHKLSVYDSSKIKESGKQKIRWALIGYGQNKIVKDFVWLSSYKSDLKNIGTIEPQQLRERETLKMAGFLPYWQTKSINAANKIDPAKVKTLLGDSPDNINKVTNVLGKPVARGMMYNSEYNKPYILSAWTSMRMKMEGRESNFVLPSADKKTKDQKQGKSFMVMDVDITRLLIAHNKQGAIKTVYWMHPTSSD